MVNIGLEGTSIPPEEVVAKVYGRDIGRKPRPLLLLSMILLQC